MVMRPILINIMTKAAEKAGKALLRDFSRVDRLRVVQKGVADFVSTADFKAQEILREELSLAKPEMGFLMEEDDGIDDSKKTKERWIVDPLDGTANFLHAIPHWSISIAVERDNEIVAGVIYNPISNEMFWAEKGVGAYIGHNRIRVSGRNDLSECLLSTNVMHKGNADKTQLAINRVSNMCDYVSGVRREGSTALDLAYVAAGRYDGFWTSADIGMWDVAAGYIIVKEAGGVISPLKQGDDPVLSTHLIASNKKIHDEIVKKIRSI